VGAVPGVLKAKFGAHEVIVTIMLNFIVLALLNYLTSEKVHVPDTLHTPELKSGALPRLGDFSAFHGSAANATILLAILAAIVLWWYPLPHAPRLRAARGGLQPRAAEYAA
jgi:simple sugar transport system permease protein